MRYVKSGAANHKSGRRLIFPAASSLRQGVLYSSRSRTQLTGATFSGLCLTCKVIGATPTPSINIEAPQPHPPAFLSVTLASLAPLGRWLGVGREGRKLPGQGRVYQESHMCWCFPDGRGFRITAYPPSWAQGAARRQASPSPCVHMHACTGVCEHDYLFTAG